MSRFMSFLWSLQFFFLLGLAIAFAAVPLAMPKLLFKSNPCAYFATASCHQDISGSPAGQQGGIPYSPAGDTKAEEGGSNWNSVLTHATDLEQRSSKFIIATMRLLAALLLVMALFKLHAAMREDQRIRRRMALIFGVLGVGLLLVFWTSTYRAFLWFVAFTTACNLAYGVLPGVRSLRTLSGSADTRPPELWVLWAFQGMTFLAAATVCALSPGALYDLLRAPEMAGEGPAVSPLMAAILRLFSPAFLSLGLFSFLGMKASREWHWRAYSRLFATLYAVMTLVLLWAWDGSVFKAQVGLGWFVVPVMGLVNYAYGLKTDNWFAEEVGEGPDGWITSDVLIGALLILQTFLSRRRPHYARGAAAEGHFTLLHERFLPLPPEEGSPRDEEQMGIPLVDFFEEGQSFRTVVRFSTNGPDDAGLASRGVAIRIENSGRKRFDLLLSTGAYMGPENILEFSLTHIAQFLGPRVENWMWRKSMKLREGALAALHRAPSCYSHLEYYSKTVRFWITQDGVRYLARFRLVPESTTPGSPPRADALEGSRRFGRQRSWRLARKRDRNWIDRRRLKRERRSADYLKQVLKRRLESSKVEFMMLKQHQEDSKVEPMKVELMKMRLEVQLHHQVRGDDLHWFNPGVDWENRGTLRWRSLGVVTLERVLPDLEAEALALNPAVSPPSLGIPVSSGPFDPRSIADTEKRVHRRVQSARKWLLRAFGPPPMDSKPHE